MCDIFKKERNPNEFPGVWGDTLTRYNTGSL